VTCSVYCASVATLPGNYINCKKSSLFHSFAQAYDISSTCLRGTSKFSTRKEASRLFMSREFVTDTQLLRKFICRLQNCEQILWVLSMNFLDQAIFVCFSKNVGSSTSSFEVATCNSTTYVLTGIPWYRSSLLFSI
jgi:hypothetical protein